MIGFHALLSCDSPLYFWGIILHQGQNNYRVFYLHEMITFLWLYLFMNCNNFLFSSRHMEGGSKTINQLGGGGTTGSSPKKPLEKNSTFYAAYGVGVTSLVLTHTHRIIMGNSSWIISPISSEFLDIISNWYI